MNKHKKAFTLIELLVVIAIVGILATLAVVALQQARSRARDSKRVADIRQIQTALELFFYENGRYPSLEEWNSGSIKSELSNTVYMHQIPLAPSPADGECNVFQNDFYYQVSADNSTYTISFCLGNNISSLSKGLKCATPGGILDYNCFGGSTGNDGGDFGGNDNPNVCYPECATGYVCQDNVCVVDNFNCGEDVIYHGHTYKTVAIGDRCWFKENLKSNRFKNGDLISRGTTVTPPWVSYHDNPYHRWPTSDSTSRHPLYDFYSPSGNNIGLLYGYVYSTHAIIDPRGLCPEGWEIPTKDDFDSLIAGHNVLNLRSCRQTNSPLGEECQTSEHPYWLPDVNHSDVYGTDDLGFSLLPGGFKDSHINGNWQNFNTSFYLWTKTMDDSNTKLYYVYNSGGPELVRHFSAPVSSHSSNYYIRCIKKYDLSPKTLPSVLTSSASEIKANIALLKGSVISNGGSIVRSRGFVWGENNNPLIGDDSSKFIILRTSSDNNFTYNAFYGLKPGKTYYFRAYALNEVGIAYGNVLSFTTTNPCSGLENISYHGHTYPTVAIGDQCWFKENLRSDKFRNGDLISKEGVNSYCPSPWITYHDHYSNLYNYDYCPFYNFYPNLGHLYGYVYSAHAVIDPRGLCPEGWEVPTVDEYNSLFSNIGGYDVLNLRSCRQTNSPLGGECQTSEHPYWLAGTFYGSDDLGFSLLPSGSKYSTSWGHFGYGINLWTRTASSSKKSLHYTEYSGGLNVSTHLSSQIDRRSAFYIRCIKKYDLSPKTIPSVLTSSASEIKANTALLKGSVLSDGGSPILSRGFVWSEGNNPLIEDNNSKFVVLSSNIDPFSFNAFYGLKPGKTYYFRAYALNEVGIAYGNVLSFTTTNPCSGLENISYHGHTYPTVAIGDQCWFKENLRSDKFRNGESIPRIKELSATANYDFYSHNNIDVPYGYVYSAHAVIDPRGLCPEGWAVPTKDDFITLYNSIGYYNFLNLRSCRQVNSPLGGECQTSEHPYWANNTLYGSDDLGFSLLPGGRKVSSTSNWNVNYYLYLWTRTLDDSGTALYYAQGTVSNSSFSVSSTVSLEDKYSQYVRCIKE